MLLTLFWDWDGVVHTEFLQKGQTINSDRYVDTLKRLRVRLQRTRKDKQAILQHDNARPHTSHKTQEALQRLRFTDILPHPAYSPDLAPCDFWLFPKLKDHLKGQRYSCDAEVEAAVRQWCRQQPPQFFADGIKNLVARWRKCVARNGDYVEK